jgi:hypothetical protein
MVVPQHHVMHCPDFGGVEGRVGVIAHRKDIAERLPVALDFQEGLLIGAERLLTVDRSRRVVLVDLVTLNAVRALDGASERRPAQASLPSRRRPQDVSQVLAHLMYFAQNCVVLLGQRGSDVDRHLMRCRIHLVSLAL